MFRSQHDDSAWANPPADPPLRRFDVPVRVERIVTVTVEAHDKIGACEAVEDNAVKTALLEAERGAPGEYEGKEVDFNAIEECS